MPRYFTHVRNDVGYAIDQEGQDFPDLATARAAAVQGAIDMLCDELRGSRFDVSLELQIDDAAGTRVATIPVTAKVTGLGG